MSDVDNQLDLFHPNARISDPDTSHAAAESIEPVRGRQCRQVLEVITAAGERGATAHEVTMRMAYSGYAQQSVIARRCTDLRDAGLIVDSGDRRPGGSGRLLIVWSAAP